MKWEASRFVAVGVNHHKAPVAVREAFYLNEERRNALLAEARAAGLEGAVLLSTCNRTELYANTDAPELAAELLLRYAGKESAKPSEAEFQAFGFADLGHDALRHFFAVACGVDSLVLGDLQIVQQVKQAFKHTVDAGNANGYLHKLMQHVLRAHKRARTETAIGRGAASTAHAAIQQLKEALGAARLSQSHVLLVGAGKIGKVTCANLNAHGVRRITVLNRGIARAERLASRFEAHAAPLSDLVAQLQDADIVFVATGAENYILTPDMLPADGRQRTLVDLSVPRNIDPACTQLEGVTLVDMDTLRQAQDAALAQREAARPQVLAIIEEEIQAFEQWLAVQRLGPTIRALTEKFEEIKRQELDSLRHKLPKDELARVEVAANRIVSKIVAHSVETLRSDPAKGAEMATLVQQLFQLNV